MQIAIYKIIEVLTKGREWSLPTMGSVYILCSLEYDSN
jgi:hypothetical protein